MTEVLKGKPVADKIKSEIIERVKALGERNLFPKLVVVRLGENPNDISYERGILKNCDALGIKTEVVVKDPSMSTEDLLAVFDELNGRKDVSGILLFRPLPKQIDEGIIRTAIDPDKDVDCMHPINLARVFECDFSRFVPATPMAAMKVMEHYGIDVAGKMVAVINRSLVFGRPLAMMLLEKNATPMICHSKTPKMKEVTKNADVVVIAIGRAKMYDKSYFNENSVIIDVGVSADSEGNISGDADFENLKDYVKVITPVKGGVGAVTNTILLGQVVTACEIQNA